MRAGHRLAFSYPSSTTSTALNRNLKPAQPNRLLAPTVGNASSYQSESKPSGRVSGFIYFTDVGTQRQPCDDDNGGSNACDTIDNTREVHR